MIHGGVQRRGGGNGESGIALATGRGENMRLDARTADSRICGSHGAIKDEDGGEAGIRDMVEGQLLQRQVRQRGGHGRHGYQRRQERLEILNKGKEVRIEDRG